MDITVADIVKDFGGTAALRGVSLTFRAGELIALLGPSGSGKTTLLRIIAGLEIPDGGSVLFGDENATAIPVRKRQVGFVFQHYALFRHLTVFDNIAYGLRARSRARRPGNDDLRRRVSSLLELVQLEGLETRFPAQLSGGQRQRVALARALAVEPRVLLLDEPFGALDAKVRKDLRRWLRGIHERTGQTTIFVTHDQDEALELADRVAVLNEGRLEQIGTPSEIYDEPASPFVMSFVGDTTRLPVVVADAQVHLAGQPTGLTLAGQPDGAADLFVRPWDLALCADEHGSLGAVVSSTRRSGQTLRTSMLLEASGITVEVDVAAGPILHRGDRIRLKLRGGRLFPSTA